MMECEVPEVKDVKIQPRGVLLRGGEAPGVQQQPQWAGQGARKPPVAMRLKVQSLVVMARLLGQRYLVADEHLSSPRAPGVAMHEATPAAPQATT